MVRGSAQGDGYAGLLQPGQEQIEQQRVLGGEPARQQVLRRVIKVQLALNTSQRRSARLESSIGSLELIRLGDVLRVVDHHVVAAGVRQSVIARARLPPWFPAWHDDQCDIGGQVRRTRGLHGFKIILFEQDAYVQLRLRPMQLLQRPAQLRDHRDLVIQRHENGVDG